MTPRGFVWLIGATALGFLLALLPRLGSAALWVMLPFTLAALGALWIAIRRNSAEAALREVFHLSPTEISIIRHDTDQAARRWQADPYFVRMTIYADGPPVGNYLTFRDAKREVELGAFLSPGEREELFVLLARHIRIVRRLRSRTDAA